jgi:hypothetical protein
MPYLRLAICALTVFLVGCATSTPVAYSPVVTSYHEVPAAAIATSEKTYSAPLYVPGLGNISKPAYYSSAGTAYEPAVALPPGYGAVAENGSYYGQSNVNGVPKTVAVGGYYRKDGTYVRGHYRSAPGSNPPSTRRRK